MSLSDLNVKAQEYLNHLCLEITTRIVGSDGNRDATKWFVETIKPFGFNVNTPEFDCINWTENGADITVDGHNFDCLPSPYTLGYHGTGELCIISTLKELKNTNFKDKILLIKGDLAKEPLMPKNFIFYNPEHHREIIRLLEVGQPKAIITATGQDPMIASGVYPFPVIEDGDFDIPSVCMKDIDGANLAKFHRKTIALNIDAKRSAAKGYNIIATKGDPKNQRIVITAHIDAKQDTSGALDNGTGIVALLLLAELLNNYTGKYSIEITVLNGEDFYSVPGQMQYYHANQGRWDDIVLAINIDGAGYYQGKTSYCTFNCSKTLDETIHQIFNKGRDIINGPQWVESDHSIFVQQGRPAMAIISEIFQTDLTVKITHTPKDNPGIVDISKIVDIALLLAELIHEINL